MGKRENSLQTQTELDFESVPCHLFASLARWICFLTGKVEITVCIIRALLWTRNTIFQVKSVFIGCAGYFVFVCLDPHSTSLNPFLWTKRLAFIGYVYKLYLPLLVLWFLVGFSQLEALAVGWKASGVWGWGLYFLGFLPVELLYLFLPKPTQPSEGEVPPSGILSELW